MRNPGRSGLKPADLRPGRGAGPGTPPRKPGRSPDNKAKTHSVRTLSAGDSWSEEARTSLAAALAELQLPLDERACALLLDYLGQLQKWNAVYNLTAIRDPREMLVQHLFDCLAIIRPLREQGLLGKNAVVLDVGSGGGLPGALIAIVEPGAQVHCVDTVSKKAAFITQLRAELSLPNLHVHHARVEQLVCPDDMPAASLIVSRAFSSLAQFVSCSAHLLAPGGAWAAMKGRLPDDELAELPADVQVATPITLRVPKLDAVRHLLILRRGGSPA